MEMIVHGMSRLEVRNRLVKAARLAEVLSELGGTAEQVACLGPQGWLLAADCAGVKPPSEITKEWVVEILAATAKEQAA
jgi:hypothetical protein